MRLDRSTAAALVLVCLRREPCRPRRLLSTSPEASGQRDTQDTDVRMHRRAQCDHSPHTPMKTEEWLMRHREDQEDSLPALRCAILDSREDRRRQRARLARFRETSHDQADPESCSRALGSYRLLATDPAQTQGTSAEVRGSAVPRIRRRYTPPPRYRQYNQSSRLVCPHLRVHATVQQR